MQYINSCISKVLEQWGGESRVVLPAKHNQNRVAQSQSEFVRHAWLQETYIERHKETKTDIDCSNANAPKSHSPGTEEADPCPNTKSPLTPGPIQKPPKAIQ